MSDSPAATDPEAPTWYWRIDPSLLKEAAEIRKRDPNEFRGAVLTYFGFGGRDDGPILERMRAHPEAHGAALGDTLQNIGRGGGCKYDGGENTNQKSEHVQSPKLLRPAAGWSPIHSLRRRETS